MSLLIKALKQAERRHAEATAGGADLEIATDPGVPSGHGDPGGPRNHEIRTPLPPINQLLPAIADRTAPAELALEPGPAAAPQAQVSSTPQAQVSAARMGSAAIAAAKAASDLDAAQKGGEAASRATPQGVSPVAEPAGTASRPAALRPSARQQANRARLVVLAGLAAAAIGIGGWLAWSLSSPARPLAPVLASGPMPATDPMPAADPAAMGDGMNAAPARDETRGAAGSDDSGRVAASQGGGQPIAADARSAATGNAPTGNAPTGNAPTGNAQTSNVPAGNGTLPDDRTIGTERNSPAAPTAGVATNPARPAAAPAPIARTRPLATAAKPAAAAPAAPAAAVPAVAAAARPASRLAGERPASAAGETMPAPAASAAPAAGRAAGSTGGIRLQPGDVNGERVATLAAAAYSALGRHDDAAARAGYEEVIALDRNHADAWIGLATLAARRGDAATAERLYQRALEIDPNHVAARAGLLSTRSATDPVTQESQLRSLIALDPNQPALHFALGNTLARQARWHDAQQSYFAAFSADPKRPEYAFNLAVSLDRLRQPRPAIDYYRRALSLATVQPAGFPVERARSRAAELERALGQTAGGPADAGGMAR
ncbi:MAG: tetratricopeptide repeat protein [Lautropia sp.]